MSGAWRVILCAALVSGVGCGDGGGSGNDNRDPDPTSTVTPVVAPTATPQSTPVPSANAWSVGARSEPGRVEGIILRSSDAGAHWTETLSVEGADFGGVSFADASRGWVVGFTGGSGEILRSDDSGLTWESQRPAVALDETFSLHAVQALSVDRVVAVGGGAPIQGTGNAPSLILHTDDAGATWTVAPITGSGGGDATRTRLTGVCITSAGIGIAVGTGTTSSLAAYTSDHGASWTDVTASVQGSSGGELFDVACLDDEFWITTNGDTFVRRSADGGVTWHDALPVELDTGIVDISAPGRGVAVAVGVDGMNQPLIIRTEDAGITWTRQPIDAIMGEASLLGVAFAGLNDGTAVGGPFGPAPAESGSLTVLSPAAGSAWTRGEPLDGSILLYDVARLP